MGFCGICGRISAGADHVDCVERRRVEQAEAEGADCAGKDGPLASELDALLGHIARDSKREPRST